MQGDSIFALILGVIIVIGLIILIIIELTKPKILGTVRQNPYQQMYIPTYHPKYQPNYQPNYEPKYQPNYQPKIPVTPVKPVKPVKPVTPPQIVGDRSTPFCKHTLKGCYPGTQTPIR